jgi:dolichol-phosphate mannosyltransferase
MGEATATLVVIATYNEIENLPRLVETILHLPLDTHILVVDDGSPDGTGRWCDEKAASEPRLRCIHRPGKGGLGTATIAGLRYALERGYRYALTMDADFSHPPESIPELLSGMEPSGGAAVDVMIGSRYVRGGRVEDWPLVRRWMSRCVNFYARCLLGLPVRDCSGAFRCYRTQTLARVDLDAVRSRGYSFFEEILWRLKCAGAVFGETPITFVDRQYGASKINLREAFRALLLIFQLGAQNLFVRRPRDAKTETPRRD